MSPASTWTNVADDGIVDDAANPMDDDCNGWTTGSNAFGGAIGNTVSVTSDWTTGDGSALQTCDTVTDLRLYCFGQ